MFKIINIIKKQSVFIIKVQSMALCLILNVRLVLVRVVFILIITQRLLQHGEAAYHVLGSSLRTAHYLSDLTPTQLQLPHQAQ